MILKFKDGTQLKNVQLVYEQNKVLYIKTIKTPVETLKEIFKNAEKTEEMTLNETVFEGYTTFDGIVDYDNGILEVRMCREGETVAERLDKAEADLINKAQDIDDCNMALAELGEIIGEIVGGVE